MSHTCERSLCKSDFPSSHMRKSKQEAKRVHFSDIFYLTQFTPSTIISTGNRYRKLLQIFYVLFFPPYQVFKTRGVLAFCSTPGFKPAAFQVPRSPAWLAAGMLGEHTSRPFLSREGTLHRGRPQGRCPAPSDSSCVFERVDVPLLESLGNKHLSTG